MKRLMSLLLALLLVVSPLFSDQKVEAAGGKVVINEVEADDPDGGPDWVELYNAGDEKINIKGYFIGDDKELARMENKETTPIQEDTWLEPKAFYILEGNKDFQFGLGKKKDAVYLYDANQVEIDHITWAAQMTQNLAREVDGTGLFMDLPPTKGKSNQSSSVVSLKDKIFINEIAFPKENYLEIVNPKDEELDLSGVEIRDNSDDHRFRLNEGTIIGPRAYVVVEANTLGKVYDDLSKTYTDDVFVAGVQWNNSDQACLYDSQGELLDSYTWTSAPLLGSYSRLPDGNGAFVDHEMTKGSENVMTVVEPKADLVINEIESNGDNVDWVEIYNRGGNPVDLEGYFITDDGGLSRLDKKETTPIQGSTLLQAGEYFVFEENTHFTFGLGKDDQVTLYNRNKEVVDEHAWQGHASEALSRMPNGTGNFVDIPSTKGAENKLSLPKIVINEIVTGGEATDWVEVINMDKNPVDISAWYMLDADEEKHAKDITPVAANTILQPGQIYVFDQNKDFTFGLGSDDKVSIYNDQGLLITEYAWTGKLQGPFARVPDGIGELQSVEKSTKNDFNIPVVPVVINEVESSAPNGGKDWIELANPTDQEIDISGLVIKDNDDGHAFIIPGGTKISAQGYLVFTEDDFGYGLGKEDSVRIFQAGRLVASVSWSGHQEPTYGLYPDFNGKEYQVTKEETPGKENLFKQSKADVKKIAWPGKDDVEVIDQEAMFLEDSSGLDYHNGALWAVDNGTGKIFKLDIDEDGNVHFAKGFEKGKRIQFQKDQGNASAKGPDAEGISLDANGNVYLAVERDNANKGVNFNAILMADPNEQGPDIPAKMEWDITKLLPDVTANTGIEAVEWVSNDHVAGKLFDQKLNKPFAPSDYKGQWANGVFFTALENDGKIYAFVLKEDQTAELVSTIDPLIGGAMGLNFDEDTGMLWVHSDDGYGNTLAMLTLNGTNEADIVHVDPPKGIDRAMNNEGFCILPLSYSKEGFRPVYWFADGFVKEALRKGYLPGLNSNPDPKPDFDDMPIFEKDPSIEGYLQSDLYLRPSKNSSEYITILPKGSYVKGIASGAWLEIEYKGQKAYLAKKFVAGIKPKDSVEEEMVSGYTRSSIYVRPSMNSKDYLGILPSKTFVTGKRIGSWVEFTHMGSKAYVAYWTLDLGEEVHGYLTSNLYLRPERNSKDYLTILARGRKVSGRRLGSWLEIEYEGKKAYLAIRFVFPEVQKMKGTLTSSLYVRKEKNDKDSLGILGKGSQVEGMIDGSWLMIDYLGSKAYIALKFVK